MKKKKNAIQDQKQILLIGFAIVGLAFLFVSILLISPFFFQRDTNAFNQTKMPFVTNAVVATLLMQTSIAGTEHASVTSTARP